jgi:hypothetical protein
MHKRQPETSDTPKMLSLKDLKERGWTAALVKQFLGEPDALKPNPYSRKAAHMHCTRLPVLSKLRARRNGSRPQRVHFFTPKQAKRWLHAKRRSWWNVLSRCRSPSTACPPRPSSSKPLPPTMPITGKSHGGMGTPGRKPPREAIPTFLSGSPSITFVIITPPTIRISNRS